MSYLSYETGAWAAAAVGTVTMLACSEDKKRTGGKVGGVVAGLSTLIGLILTLPRWFQKKGEQALKWAANKALKGVEALKGALNSLFPGLGKLLEPLESLFQWLKENAGSVAQVIVMVVGGYIVLKVIRR